MNSPTKKPEMAIVWVCDGDPDELTWAALKKSDVATTAAIVDLRTFPRETIDELLKRLYNKFGKEKQNRETKNKI